MKNPISTHHRVFSRCQPILTEPEPVPIHHQSSINNDVERGGNRILTTMGKNRVLMKNPISTHHRVFSRC